MPGLFIRRQAEMLADDNEVTVLYVQEDPACIQKYEPVSTMEEGVRVVRVYYAPPAGRLNPLNRVVKLFRFYRAHQVGFRALSDFHPDLLHVHVLTRHGVVAWWHKIRKGIPYVITEHWSRYFPENGTYEGPLRKWITKRVVRYSSGMIAVSDKLKSAMIKEGLNAEPFSVIGNPVGMGDFSLKIQKDKGQPSKTRIIHVSCFEDKSKNITGFLRVMGEVWKKTSQVECRLIGEGPDLQYCKDYADALGLTKELITFTGLMEGVDLIREFQEADFLVLSSRYETFGTVIVEAMACGVPVISTDVGIASQVIDRSSGIVVPSGDEAALKSAILEMIATVNSLDPSQIRKRVVDRFSTEEIRKQLCHFYDQLLAGKNKR
jgi:glycosyltransferase involved in cell wall biosynthesis